MDIDAMNIHMQWLLEHLFSVIRSMRLRVELLDYTVLLPFTYFLKGNIQLFSTMATLLHIPTGNVIYKGFSVFTSMPILVIHWLLLFIITILYYILLVKYIDNIKYYFYYYSYSGYEVIYHRCFSVGFIFFEVSLTYNSINFRH